MTKPMHIKNRLDALEYKKDVLEKRHADLVKVGASKTHVQKAHSKFFKAYLTFANVATRAAEQGIL